MQEETLQFDFEYADAEHHKIFHPLSLGDITVTGPLGLVTTKHQRPDRSVFLLDDIASLMSSLSAFLQQERMKRQVFESLTGYFSLTFEKRKQDRVAVSQNSYLLGVFPERHVYGALKNAVTLFREKYIPEVVLPDEVWDELIKDEMNEFNSSYNEFLSLEAKIGTRQTNNVGREG